MDKQRTDDVIKLLNKKINFFILQNNAAIRMVNDTASNFKSPNGKFSKYREASSNESEQISNKRYTESLIPSQNCNYCHKTECVKEKEEKEEEGNKEKEKEEENDPKEEEDGSRDYTTETNTETESEGIIEDFWEDVINWKFCSFSDFNVNICNCTSDDSFNNRIKEFHKSKIQNFKSNCEHYYSINENDVIESFDVNICILEALKKNRIDLLMNKLKEWKIMFKMENIVPDKHAPLENYTHDHSEINNNCTNIYLMLKYPGLFKNYYFIDENDFSRKKETKQIFIKDSLSLKVAIERKKNEWDKKYEDTVARFDNKSGQENRNKKVIAQTENKPTELFSDRNANIFLFKKMEACLNVHNFFLFSWIYKYYLEKYNNSNVNLSNNKHFKKEIFYYIYNYKKWKETKKILELWRNFCFSLEKKNSISEHLFRKEMIPHLKCNALHVAETNKYKKKVIMDYNYVYKKNFGEMTTLKLKNYEQKKYYILFNATFPFLNIEIRKRSLKHYMTFANIGEDFNFFEVSNIIYDKKEILNFFLLLINEYYIIYTHKNSFFMGCDGNTCFSYSLCDKKSEEQDYKKMDCSGITENMKGSINTNNNNDNLNNLDEPNEKKNYAIYALSYNYFNNTIMACSKDYIYIYDINCSKYKKKILLLDEYEEEIGEMTAVCYLHSFTDEVENRNKKKEKNKKEIDGKGCDKKRSISNNTSYCFDANLEKKMEVSDITSRFFDNCGKTRNDIFFIGTKAGKVYMYNELHKRINKDNINCIVCMDSFTTSENSKVIQLVYYEQNGKHCILASSVNDVYIRLYYINGVGARKKENEENDDTAQYIKNKKSWKDIEKSIKFYRENRDNQPYYFDILQNLLFSGDLYGNVLIYNINNRNLIYKKKLTYAPIVCLSINKIIPLMLLATSYNFSHPISKILYKRNKKQLIYEMMKYKNNYAKEFKRPIYMTCLSLWFIYELLNLYT